MTQKNSGSANGDHHSQAQNTLAAAAQPAAARLFEKAEAEELAELEAEVAQEPGNPDLDERLAQAVLARLDSAPAPKPDPAPVGLSSVIPLLPRPTERAVPAVKDKHEKRSPFGSVGKSFVIFAAAAALLIVLLRPDSKETPMYEMAMKGDDRVLGATTDTEPVRVSMSSSLDITLRPETAAEQIPKLQAYLLRADNLEPWAAPFTAAPQGTMRLRDRVSNLQPLTPGKWELVIVIGGGRGLPSAQQVKEYLRNQPTARKLLTPEGGQIHRAPLEVLPQ